MSEQKEIKRLKILIYEMSSLLRFRWTDKMRDRIIKIVQDVMNFKEEEEESEVENDNN